jgi:hypothetical protein
MIDTDALKIDDVPISPQASIFKDKTMILIYLLFAVPGRLNLAKFFNILVDEAQGHSRSGDTAYIFSVNACFPVPL